MKVLIWIKDFILHFIRRILQIVISSSVAVICLIIYLVTYEPGYGTRVTTRKVKRIRALTKVKLYAYKYFNWLFDFIHDDYLKRLYGRFNFLINKK